MIQIVQKLNRLKHIIRRKNSLKSLFIWEFSQYVAMLRIQILIIGFILVFSVIAIRLLMIAGGDFNSVNRVGKTTNYYRLNINDRNNNLLAVNLPISSLFANPRKLLDPISSAQKLSYAFPELNYNKILSDLNSNKSFVWIKRDATPQDHEKIYNLGIPGLEFEREQKRIYTYGNLLSHVLGYVSRDLDGLAGIERHFNEVLTQKKDINNIAKDSLTLSIDVRVQNILSEEIEKTMEKFSAKGAAGIIVNPNNGEILALVSKPDFDPHYPGKASNAELFNMATQGVYEMGSGMKSFTMVIGLDTEATSMYDAYDLTYMKINGFEIKDLHPSKGWQSVPHIFLKSSNIGISQIMFEIDKKSLEEYFTKLGFLDQLQIELPERAKPLFPKADRWSDIRLVTMSYGYGLSVSPLHFMQAMVPVINGGIMYPLTLIKKDENNPILGKRIFKKETSDSMRQLLNLVVNKGTGSKAKIDGYYIGGKTGTANIAHGGKYDKTRRISSFFAVIPASNPQYMIYVIYNEPQGIQETFGFAGGGWTAAPTVGAVLKRLITLYNIEKPDKSSQEVQELINIEYEIKDGE